MAKKTREPKIRRIRIGCAGGCKATPETLHMSPGDVVVIFARGSDVEVNFVGKSPFKSGKDPIKVASGTAHPEVVGSKTGTFEYRPKCTNPSCPTGAGNPVMIVP